MKFLRHLLGITKLDKEKNTILFFFNIHGTVHRSMTSSNNQRDAA